MVELIFCASKISYYTQLKLEPTVNNIQRFHSQLAVPSILVSFACQYLNLPLEVCRIPSPLSFENLRISVLFLLWGITDLLIGFGLVTGHQFRLLSH